jgi:cobalt/nickel transport system ATP-binding protein
MNKVIEIKNLKFRYSKNQNYILNEIDLQINKNETFGIIGPTGAGKSTLLFHLNGILQGEGEILIEGVKISKSSLKSIRDKVGLVFQNPDNQLFCPTVYDDIAFGLIQRGEKSSYIADKVKDIMQKFELQSYAELSTHHLSFGEKKRVSLASIMVMKPEIICFDEPFANLDYHSIYHIIDEIKTLDITKIIISQDILLAMSICDRIAVMNHGRILCVDTPQEIISKYRHLLVKNNMDYKPYLELIKKNL